jgi:type IV secretory pathway VirJ component
LVKFEAYLQNYHLALINSNILLSVCAMQEYGFGNYYTSTGRVKKLLLIILTALLCLDSGTVSAITPDSLYVEPFGKLYVHNISPTPENIVLVFPGNMTDRHDIVNIADEIASAGNVVVVVDMVHYFHEKGKRQEECTRIVTDFVDLGIMIEKRFRFQEYRPPILLGFSEGASFVYALLAQSHRNTFIGGISAGFCDKVTFPIKLCEVNGLQLKTDKSDGVITLQPYQGQENHWMVINTGTDRLCKYDPSDFVRKTSGAELITLPGKGQNVLASVCRDLVKRLSGNYEICVTKDNSGEKIKDLPIFIIKPKFPGAESPIALLISGDGGWYSFEQSICDRLAESGVISLGMDSRKYFWKRKTPEETAADVAKVLTFYGDRLGKERFVLIGYSLGSEIVPFIYNRLPREIKEKVQSAILLSPDETTDFEIHISNMLGMGNRQNTYNVPEEIRKMNRLKTLIIFGAGEKSPMPGILEGSGAIIRELPGDHHYKFNVPLIVKTMWDSHAL